MKIVKISDEDFEDLREKKSQNARGKNLNSRKKSFENLANFDDSKKNSRKKSFEKSNKFAKNRAENDFENAENFVENPREIYESYENFYEKNGKDLTGFSARNSFQKSRENSFQNSRKNQKNARISAKDFYENEKIKREKIARKIQKEKDFRANLANGNLENATFEITKISLAARTAGRYNIFVNGEFSFSLDEIQLADLQIKKGEILPAEKYLRLKNESDFGKNYVRALDQISRRKRSEKEIRDYGFRKNWSRENIEKVVKRLREKNYLDDEKFAESFVNSRANYKNFSRKKMEIELFKKGISREIISRILNENENFDEQNSLKNLVKKKRAKYEKLANGRQKFIAYLARQGFNFDDIKNVLAENFDEN